MRLHLTTVCLTAALAIPALGQEPAGGEEGARAAVRQQRGSQDRPAMTIGRIRQELNLDAQQQAEFDRIAAEFRKERSGGGLKRMRELTDELRRARQAGDEQRAAEIRRQLRESRSGGGLEEFLDRIEGILRDDQRARLAEIRQRLAAQRGGERGPVGQLRQLRAELELSDEQAEQYDALYAELEEKVDQAGAHGPEAEELIRQIQEAADAGDEERVRQLRSRLPDARAQNERAIAEFFDRLESILQPEQVRTLRQFRERLRAGRRQLDLRACFQFVSRLDLDEVQRRSLRDIRRDALRAEREAGRDPEKLGELTQHVQQQIRDLLTEEQAARFDRWLASRQSERPDRDRQRRGRRAAEEPEPTP